MADFFTFSKVFQSLQPPSTLSPTPMASSLAANAEVPTFTVTLHKKSLHCKMKASPCIEEYHTIGLKKSDEHLFLGCKIFVRNSTFRLLTIEKTLGTGTTFSSNNALFLPRKPSIRPFCYFIVTVDRGIHQERENTSVADLGGQMGATTPLHDEN